MLVKTKEMIIMPVKVKPNKLLKKAASIVYIRNYSTAIIAGA
jgi:hypothetical protein